jgi:hypothetical protein
LAASFISLDDRVRNSGRIGSALAARVAHYVRDRTDNQKRRYYCLFRGAATIDDKVKIKCSKCSMIFRERAQRIRSGFQMQCPHCLKMLTFDSDSEDINIRRVLSAARELRPPK